MVQKSNEGGANGFLKSKFIGKFLLFPFLLHSIHRIISIEINLRGQGKEPIINLYLLKYARKMLFAVERFIFFNPYVLNLKN